MTDESIRLRDVWKYQIILINICYDIMLLNHIHYHKILGFFVVAFLGFFVPLKNGDVTITGEGLKLLICARHSMPFSSEVSRACHTYCDTGHPFTMVISEDPWHSRPLPNVWQLSCHYLFLRHRSVVAGIRTTNFPHTGPTLLSTALLLRSLWLVANKGLSIFLERKTFGMITVTWN